MKFNEFLDSLMVSLSWVANQLVTYTKGEDTYVGRKMGDNLAVVNARLLYRIASRESIRSALDYLMSDQFMNDARDEEEVGVRLLPLTSSLAA